MNEEIKKKLFSEPDAPLEIPNVDKLLNVVLEIIMLINTEEMQQMEIIDPVKMERLLEQKYQDFADRYYGLFKLLLERANREENILKIITIFERLKKIEEGKVSYDYEYKKFTEGLNDEFIYSKYGGKQKFEAFMMKKNKCNKTNKINNNNSCRKLDALT